jgi:hypothetical protein
MTQYCETSDAYFTFVLLFCLLMGIAQLSSFGQKTLLLFLRYLPQWIASFAAVLSPLSVAFPHLSTTVFLGTITGSLRETEIAKEEWSTDIDKGRHVQTSAIKLFSANPIAIEETMEGG